jgi:hypothetical protein
MSDKNMFDAAIESLVKDAFNRNKPQWMDAYIQGKLIVIDGDGSVSVIDDYKLPPK